VRAEEAKAFIQHAGRDTRASTEDLTMENILDTKTQLLVALGAAAAARCQHCFATLYSSADKAGVTDREVRSAVAIAMKVATKAQDFMSAFIEQTTNGAVPAGETPGGCACG
jgi:AhpD family alkylhydroperoxidase